MDPYENLAQAIILQAVKDYRLTDDECELAEIERFFRSGRRMSGMSREGKGARSL